MVGSAAPSPTTHLVWFGNGLLVFFLVPWVSTDLLRLDNDLYYAIFIWVALTFLYFYVRVTGIDLVGWCTYRWRSSLFFGALAGVFVAVNVWRANPTAGPSGWLLAFEVAWRGVAYGIVDALVLTAFPLAVAIGVVGVRSALMDRAYRLRLGALTLILVWAMSLVYHLGFAQFTERDLVTPQLSTTAISVPALLTANPVGSVVAQTTLHITATLRTFESDVFAPPSVEFHPPYQPPGIFGPH